MKQKNKSNTYVWIAVFIAMISFGVVIYYVNFTPTEINFTLVDDSTGDSQVKIIGTYGLRDYVILLEDRNMEDYCYATVWFNEDQTSGILTIDVYIESMTHRTIMDFGLLGNTGLLYEWSNFTSAVQRDEWVTITIEYDTTYNKGTLYVNGVALGSQHNFVSSPDYITGFYLRTDPAGAAMMYIDVK